MGVDLDAKNPGTGSLHLDAGKWSMLRQGLNLVGADTGPMARGHQEGDPVSRALAEDWAGRLQEGYESGRLKVKATPEGSLGGERREFSLQEGEDVRSSKAAPFVKDFIEFARHSGGFDQSRS